MWSGFDASQVYRTDNWTMLKTSAHWLAASTFGGLGVGIPDRCSTTRRCGGCSSATCVSAHRDGDRARALGCARRHGFGVHLGALSDFFQARESIQPWSRVRRIGRPTMLTMDHLVASAAVPFVFPP